MSGREIYRYAGGFRTAMSWRYSDGTCNSESTATLEELVEFTQLLQDDDYADYADHRTQLTLAIAEKMRTRQKLRK